LVDQRYGDAQLVHGLKLQTGGQNKVVKRPVAGAATADDLQGNARCAIHAERRMKTIVLGMGNPILRDDAVGIRLARDFRARLKANRNVGLDIDIIEDCSVGGLNLLDLVMGYQRLIVFDSIRTSEGAPGHWHGMTGATFRETMNLTNVHDANFTTALELGRQMGACVPSPENVHVFAVEIVDNTTFSESLTPELESAYADFSREIIGQALALVCSSTPPGA
jgi:hydrogenase maturation protease